MLSGYGTSRELVQAEVFCQFLSFHVSAIRGFTCSCSHGLHHHAQAQRTGYAGDEGQDGVHYHGPDVFLFSRHFRKF